MRKPKRVFKQKKKHFNPYGIKVALSVKGALLQTKTVFQQPSINENSKFNKIIALSQIANNLAENITIASKELMLHRFKTTGRYVR